MTKLGTIRHLLILGLTSVALSVGVVSLALTLHQGDNLKPSLQPSTGKEEATPKEPVHFTDGTHTVGLDIEPGVYRTKSGSVGCTYTRVGELEGKPAEVIANERTDYPAVVEIKQTDGEFRSTGCGKWTQDLSRVTDVVTTFGDGTYSDGTYIVWTDIEPGSYKNAGTKGCRYHKLSGFDGDPEDIVSRTAVTDSHLYE